MFQNGMKDNGNTSSGVEWSVRNSPSNLWDLLHERSLNEEYIGQSFKKDFKSNNKWSFFTGTVSKVYNLMSCKDALQGWCTVMVTAKI